MQDFDQNQLEHDGARAAASGRGVRSNPYLLPENMPATTGEPLDEWSRKNDAWHEGFVAASRTLPLTPSASKEQIPAAVVTTMVTRRLRWVPAVRDELERHHGTVLRVRPPRAHDRDSEGRNWDIDDFECGAVHAAHCAQQFRAIVDRLRDEFDLKSRSQANAAAGTP
jgi:hypothetical protein